MNPVNKRGGELLRWGTQAGGGNRLEAQAAALVEAARPEAPLTPEALTRMARVVQSRRHEPAVRWGRGLGLHWQLAIFALVSLASVATAKGMMTLWRRYAAPPAATDSPEHARGPTRHRAPPGVRSGVDPGSPRESGTGEAAGPRAETGLEPSAGPGTEPGTGEPAAELPLAPTGAPSRTHRSRHGGHPHAQPSARARADASAGPTPVVAPAGPATEAQLVGRAIGRLRQEHDPVGALALLDEYARTFPGGVLAAEAQAARIEATLQSGDRKAALALLDGRASFQGRWGTQWLLTRAELRASAGRYGDALADFDRVLGAESRAQASESERALYGRAVCLGRLGRGDKARADLTSYRQRFPNGAHAAEVARLLTEAKSSAAP